MKTILPIQNPVPVIIIALISTIAMSVPGNAQVRSVTQLPYPNKANSIAWIANIPYLSGAGPQQQLDLYLPTNQKNMPLIVYVHGGGYGYGDKMGDSLNPNELQLLWDGYAMASINYRLTPAAIWPAQIEDCKAAIRWLKANARQYGYDPNRIGVLGESAGGQLVAMLGTTSGSKKFDVGQNLDTSSDVTCAVDLFGPSDFTAPEMSADGGALALLGGTIQDNLDLARSASPIYYVHPDEPPLLVIHGTADHLVPFLQSERLVDAMEKAGAPFYFHAVVGAGHNPYFGLNFNASRTNFEGTGGGIGLFEDQMVEPLIFGFFRHYLLEGRKNPFTGVGLNRPSVRPGTEIGR
ncbi:MAG: alpha/beta hydrolase [Acetobacteraceae bacterium]|nr:alpha/beta hydrolase [Verrucomicrobiota bacterium]MBV8526587.1 alpha/beta hydrolase [Acetobacteraceae bacterium]